MANLENLKPFVEGADPRRSPGKPKGAKNQAGLQRKIITLFNKIATSKGQPIISDGSQITNLDMIMELALKDARYMRLLIMMFEYGYGKVIQQIEMTGEMKYQVKIKNHESDSRD